MTLSAQRNQLRSKKDESEAVPVVRLKHAVRLVVDKVDSVSPGTRYVGLENIESWSGRWLNSDQPVDIEGGATRFHAGDVLFGKLRPYLAKSLRTDGSGVCTSELLVLRPHRLEQRYLHWVTLSPHFIEAVNATTFGAKMPRASWENIGVLPVPVPPREDQQRIADFLDRKTAEIDALIAKKERMIALLNEKRQAAVSQAVCRGLNPAVATKDSGVAWLGEVPAHWKVERLVWTAKLESGHTPDKKVEAYWVDCDIPWVSLQDTTQLASTEYITETAENVNLLGIANSSARLLPARAVVFSRDATIGRCAITTRPMAVSQHFIAWLCGPRLIPEYLLFVLRSMTGELDRLCMGATLRTIGMGDVRTLSIPLPPLAEQHDIVAHIRHETRRIDSMRIASDRQVSLLREYRQALVSEAVAGRVAATESLRSTANDSSRIAIQAAGDAAVQETALFPEVFERPRGQETQARTARAVPPAFKRAVLAAELISRMHDDKSFHKIKFQKTLFLAEYHLQLPSMETHYLRDAAGPHDNASMRSIEKQLREAKWYNMRMVKGQYVFEGMEKVGSHAGYFKGFWGDYSDRLDALLGILRPMNTLQAEIVATLYAAWNDFLIRGVAFDDAMIVQEVLTNWNPAKERITEDRWHKGLGWMREKGLVPTGFGEATTKKGGEPT